MALSWEVAKNYGVNLAGKFFGSLLGVLTLGVLTRGLSLEDVGYYTTAFTFLTVFGSIADLGLTLTFTQLFSSAKTAEEEKRVAGGLLTARILISALAYGCAAGVGFLVYPIEIAKVIAVGSIAFFFLSSPSVLIGIFQTKLRMLRAMLAEIAGRLVFLVGCIVSVQSSLGAEGIMTAFVLSNLLMGILMVSLTRGLTHLHLTWDSSLIKTALTQSWPIAISTALNVIYLRGDILFLGFFRTQTDVAVYGVAYRLLDVVTALPTLLMGLTLPILSARFAAQDREGFARAFQKSLDACLFLSIPLAVGIFFTGPGLVALIAGDVNYAASEGLVRILGLSTIPLFLGALFAHASIAVRAQKKLIWGFALTALIATLSYLLFIPRFGLVGAAWTTVGSETLLALLAAVLVVKKGMLHIPLKTLGQTLLASAGMALALWISGDLFVLLQVVVGAAVFVAFLFLLGAFPKEWRRVL